MSSLSKLFPGSLRKDFGRRVIQPGSVFRIPVTNTNPPKTKRLVVLAISSDKACVGYLFFNSQVNVNVFPSARLRALHLFLEAAKREYLEHDSYLDCSQIKDIDLSELKKIIAEDPGKHIGNLSRDDLERAREIAQNAPTIPRRNKVKYGLI